MSLCLLAVNTSIVWIYYYMYTNTADRCLCFGMQAYHSCISYNLCTNAAARCLRFSFQENPFLDPGKTSLSTWTALAIITSQTAIRKKWKTGFFFFFDWPGNKDSEFCFCFNRTVHSVQYLHSLFMFAFLAYRLVYKFSGLGICSFAHFAQIKWATVSDLLRSLKTNELPWANRSGRSRQMSNREGFAHDKWAIRSKIFG